MNRRDFLKKCAKIGAGGVVLSNQTLEVGIGTKGLSPFPQLDGLGERFTFALLADPQVNRIDASSDVAQTTQKRLTEVIDEINAMRPRPPFAVFDGDLVGSVKPEQMENFVTRTKKLQTLPILVHGNHDGHPPYAEFIQMQRDLNSTEVVMFSFDCGWWHFVAFPCHIRDNEWEEKALDWLNRDLGENRHKPTIVFEHYHLMPQGLTQLEFYTYDKPLRTEIVDILAMYGNVRYVFCGHVHNGIKASVKTAWTYRGMNFITTPTVTASRNFGEEYPPFEAGMDQGTGDTGGGYYLLVDIKGNNIRVRGRLVGVQDEYIYASSFREYKGEEPLWSKNVTDYPPNSELINGSFENGLDGWMKPYRYVADEQPGFVWQASSEKAHSGSNAAYLFVREKGQPWAHDEMMELYQMVETPFSPIVKAHYNLDEQSVGGGGYIRLCAYHGSELKLLILFDWGEGDKPRNKRMASHSLWTATGEKAGAASLITMGESKEAMFWTIKAALNQWHELKVDIQHVYDEALDSSGAFQALGIDKLLVAVGVWCLDDKGSRSSAYFDDITVTPRDGGEVSTIDGEPLIIDDSVFETDFGRKSL